MLPFGINGRIVAPPPQAYAVVEIPRQPVVEHKAPTVCQATKKNGEPCKNHPKRGTAYCGVHTPKKSKMK